jgi:hypothetical protein
MCDHKPLQHKRLKLDNRLQSIIKVPRGAYCCTSKLIPLLIATQSIQIVERFDVEIHKLDGSKITIKLDGSNSNIQQLKRKLQDLEGTNVHNQQLFVLGSMAVAKEVNNAAFVIPGTAYQLVCNTTALEQLSGSWVLRNVGVQCQEGHMCFIKSENTIKVEKIELTGNVRYGFERYCEPFVAYPSGVYDLSMNANEELKFTTRHKICGMCQQGTLHVKLESPTRISGKWEVIDDQYEGMHFSAAFEGERAAEAKE